MDPTTGVVEVARWLLGRRLTTVIDGATAAVLIDEVEAYGGADDPASHAYRSATARNAPMFEAAGTLYVYRSYGMHWCANVVTGTVGDPQAVLLRGGIIVEGTDVIVARRGRTDRLTDGPGKLTQALAIDGSHSGSVLAFGATGRPIRVGLEREIDGPVAVTPRIGITKAVDRPWRFVLQPAEA